MNNELKSAMDIIAAQPATPAVAPTSGAAGTIDTPMWRELLSQAGAAIPDDFNCTTYPISALVRFSDKHTAAAVAAAREEGRREILLMMVEEAKATVEAMAKPDALHITRLRGLEARLRTAPVVGELPRIPTNAMLNAARDWSVKKYGIGIGNDAAIGCWQAMFDAIDTAPHVAKEAGKVDESVAARDVLAERRRQVEAEGWTAEQDDDYEDGELSMAAAMYAMQGDCPNLGAPADWPWSEHWWKPSTDRRNLVKAAALILADIERIDRAALARTTNNKEGS